MEWQWIKELLTFSCSLHCCSLISSTNSYHFIKSSLRDTGSNRLAGFHTFSSNGFAGSIFLPDCITILYIIIAFNAYH
uniref:Uncharacterized protein n=1 Tax=Picea sitchensis TaxID=3332 RepID=B8LN54_PICSI|nr:unknown [Picea sitchensis]